MSYDLVQEGAATPGGGSLNVPLSWLGRVRDLLVRLRLVDGRVRPLDWDPIKYGLDPSDAGDRAVMLALQEGEVPPEGTDAGLLERAGRYEARRRHCLEAERDGAYGRLPGYKLASSDGWLVTPGEAGRLVDGYDRLMAGVAAREDRPDWATPEGYLAYVTNGSGHPEVPSWTVEFVEYVRACRDTGFRVW